MKKLLASLLFITALFSAQAQSQSAPSSKNDEEISRTHWSYAILAQLSECAELDGCLGALGYFDFARPDFHLSRGDAARLAFDIFRRAERYKDLDLEIDKDSPYYNRSPLYLRSAEAKDAIKALFVEYWKDFELTENEKGWFLAPAVPERSLVSSAPQVARPENVDFPDKPSTHWAYTTLGLICTSPEFEKCHPFYERGVMFGTNELTRYEFAVAIGKIETQKTEMQRQQRVLRFPKNSAITEREIDDGIAALKTEFAPELTYWNLLPATTSTRTNAR